MSKEAPPTAPDRLTAGSLHYTRAGLVALFGWLLWGGFCFQVMERVIGAIMPLQLQAVGANNRSIALMLAILPNILGFSIGPWVSYKSDRCTHRWGRRKPFLLLSLPFLCLLLVSLGYIESIADIIRASPWLQSNTVASTPTGITLFIVGLLVVCFAFFNEFVDSVFWYLFVDVVPETYLGRFMGLFRMVGALAGFVFSISVAPYAETHARQIYLTVSLLYFFGFGLMCWRVKEAQHKPPEREGQEEANKGRGIVSKVKDLGGVIRIYARECFLSHPLYTAVYVTGFASGVISVGAFAIFFVKQIGVTVEQFFIINAWFALAGFVCNYPAGLMADRFHPVRLSVLFTLLTLPGPFLSFFYKVDTPSYILMGAIWFPIAELSNAAGSVLLNRIFPKSRYGQFSSCAGMCRQIGKMLGAFLLGYFLDSVQDYRYYLLWSGFGHFLTAAATIFIFFYWCRLGGDNYVAPLLGTVNTALSPDGANAAGGGK